MTPRFDPVRHRRRSIRLPGYGYTSHGAYFITIVTQGRACLFGDVVGGVMHLSNAGRMVQAVWDELPARYDGVQTDAFVVMPNHVHGIIVIAERPPGRAPTRGAPTDRGDESVGGMTGPTVGAPLVGALPGDTPAPKLHPVR